MIGKDITTMEISEFVELRDGIDDPLETIHVMLEEVEMSLRGRIMEPEEVEKVQNHLNTISMTLRCCTAPVTSRRIPHDVPDALMDIIKELD